MKKKLSILLLLTILLLPNRVFAAPSGSISCSSKTASVGSTITVTVSGSVNEEVMWDLTTYSSDESKLKLQSDTKFISDSFSSSLNRSFKFKAVDKGTATVRANASVAGYSGEKNNLSTSCTINIVDSASSSSSSSKGETKKEEKKSADNSLKSLSVEKAVLNPDFDKDKLEYNVEIESDEKTKIKINAETADSKAKVEGIGEVEVNLGTNKLEINVTAENGAVRTYILNVSVIEKNPIVVKVNNKKYKVMRVINDDLIPDGFEKTKIKIKGKEVEALINKKTKYRLVVLLDKNNKPGLFIYKNGKYERYSELSSSSLKLLILTPKKKDIPYKYKKCEFTVDDMVVNGYELGQNSNFKLVYALNLNTNQKGFYLYDMDEKTFQRFYNYQVELYIKLVKKFKIGLIVLAGLFSILCITIICLFTTNSKTRKKIKKLTTVK